MPNEVVIVDGGWENGTLEEFTDRQDELPPGTPNSNGSPIAGW